MSTPNRPAPDSGMTQGQCTHSLTQHGKPSGLRICYEPAWAPSRPYTTFSDGTAGQCYGSLSTAKYYIGFQSTRWSDPA